MTPRLFHLAIPFSRLASIAVAGLLLTACASSRALDDSISDITTNATIKGVLFTDMSHDYSDIDLTVFEGRLLLTGTMRSTEGRDKLIADARKARASACTFSTSSPVFKRLRIFANCSTYLTNLISLPQNNNRSEEHTSELQSH